MDILDKDNAIARKIEAFEDFKKNLVPAVDAFLREHEVEIIDLLKGQLFEGKDSEGNDLRPYYSEDLRSNGGWFKTPEAAERYAEWKRGLTYPNGAGANRNPDAPNLYINGNLFHDTLILDIADDFIAFVNTDPRARQIMERYGREKFGLNNVNFELVKDLYIKEPLLKMLRNAL